MLRAMCVISCKSNSLQTDNNVYYIDLSSRKKLIVATYVLLVFLVFSWYYLCKLVIGEYSYKSSKLFLVT